MAVGACVRKVCLSHSRLSLVPAAAARSCHKRVEREVLRDTGRHGCVLRMARLPRGISRMADRMRLVA